MLRAGQARPRPEDELLAEVLQRNLRLHGSHSAATKSITTEGEGSIKINTSKTPAESLVTKETAEANKILRSSPLRSLFPSPVSLFFKKTLLSTDDVRKQKKSPKTHISSSSHRGAEAEPPQFKISIADLTESTGDFGPSDAMQFDKERGFPYGGSTESITNPTIGPFTATRAEVDERPQTERKGVSKPADGLWLETLKSIVHGGLVESIASLSIVTSAASADADIWTIIALSLANLIGGILIIAHSLWNLKVEHPRGDPCQANKQVDRYQELLGQRKNFALHVTVAMLSFLVSGLLPPLVYGFTFKEGNDGVFKLAAVAVASLFCITALAIGKAYIQKPPKSYINTILHYAGAGIAVLVVYCIAGELAKELTEKLLWLKSGEAVVIVPFGEMSSGRIAQGSYYI